ncbi:hypothetical protein FBBNIHIM_12725 [Pseudocitrobacter vendiensis]|uniref:Uncharacterized protein n=1 Tax=Pseudocitrobacter vendiensis TaxID=2488306 RepID=A0ABM9FAT2_9ENTR|nr:hypothetical protein FBBNIHIM_12725 [Pseudocitrobacter vendiensis]
MVVREVPINFRGMVRDGALTLAKPHLLKLWHDRFPLPAGEG